MLRPTKSVSYITFKKVIKESVIIMPDNVGRKKKSLSSYLEASLLKRKKSQPPPPPIITKQTLLRRT